MQSLYLTVIHKLCHQRCKKIRTVLRLFMVAGNFSRRKISAKADYTNINNHYMQLILRRTFCIVSTIVDEYLKCRAVKVFY